LSRGPKGKRASGTEHGWRPGGAASASINWSTEPLGSLAKYFLSILTTFPSANRASKAAWRAEPKEVLNVPVRVSGMLSQAQDAVVFQQAVQHIEGLARRAGDDPG